MLATPKRTRKHHVDPPASAPASCGRSLANRHHLFTEGPSEGLALSLVSHAYHRYTEPTLDPDFRKCAVWGCREVSKVVQPRPAPAQEHSETSVAAARAIEGPDRHRGRVAVWQALRGAGEAGMTDEEIMVATGLNPSTARPRRIELVADGLVRDSGRRRLTKAKREAVVWIEA